MRNEIVHVGGQAVMEGVMMRSPDTVSIAVRKPDGSILVKKEPYISSLSNYKTRLDFQIHSFKNRWIHHIFIKDLNTLCTELLDGKYGTFLKSTKKVKNLTMSIINDENSQKENIKLLYEYVRDHLDDEIYGYNFFSRKTQDEILDKKRRIRHSD